MSVLARNLDFPILCTKKLWKFDRKIDTFRIWLKFFLNKSEINFCSRLIQIKQICLDTKIVKIGQFFNELEYIFFEKRILA